MTFYPGDLCQHTTTNNTLCMKIVGKRSSMLLPRRLHMFTAYVHVLARSPLAMQTYPTTQAHDHSMACNDIRKRAKHLYHTPKKIILVTIEILYNY